MASGGGKLLEGESLRGGMLGPLEVIETFLRMLKILWSRGFIAGLRRV